MCLCHFQLIFPFAMCKCIHAVADSDNSFPYNDFRRNICFYGKGKSIKEYCQAAESRQISQTDESANNYKDRRMGASSWQ